MNSEAGVREVEEQEEDEVQEEVEKENKFGKRNLVPVGFHKRIGKLKQEGFRAQVKRNYSIDHAKVLKNQQ